MSKYREIDILSDEPGKSEFVERGHYYRMTIRMWLNKGEPILWTRPFYVSFGSMDMPEVSEDKTILTALHRLDRECLINGLFYGIQGMRIGGTRKIRIPPHLGYREKGVEGWIPPNAVLVAEIHVIEERTTA